MKQVVLLVEDDEATALVVAVMPLARDIRILALDPPSPKPAAPIPKLEMPRQGQLEHFKAKAKRKTVEHAPPDREAGQLRRRLITEFAQTHGTFTVSDIHALGAERGIKPKNMSNTLQALKNGGQLDVVGKDGLSFVYRLARAADHTDAVTVTEYETVG